MQDESKPSEPVKTYTAEDVARDVEGPMKAGVDAELARGAAKGDRCPSFLMPLFQAGHWLHMKILDEGGNDEEGNSQSFALGQRCMAGGPDNAHRLAVEQLGRWRAGRPDRPGAALAHGLIEGTAP